MWQSVNTEHYNIYNTVVLLGGIDSLLQCRLGYACWETTLGVLVDIKLAMSWQRALTAKKANSLLGCNSKVKRGDYFPLFGACGTTSAELNPIFSSQCKKIRWQRQVTCRKFLLDIRQKRGQTVELGMRELVGSPLWEISWIQPGSTLRSSWPTEAVWTRWPPEAPSNLYHSMILCLDFGYKFSTILPWTESKPFLMNKVMLT